MGGFCESYTKFTGHCTAVRLRKNMIFTEQELQCVAELVRTVFLVLSHIEPWTAQPVPVH
jgi:hypothetical protein